MEFVYYLMGKIFDPPSTGIQTGGFPHNNHNSKRGIFTWAINICFWLVA